jgi:hypothetical protein
LARRVPGRRRRSQSGGTGTTSTGADATGSTDPPDLAEHRRTWLLDRAGSIRRSPAPPAANATRPWMPMVSQQDQGTGWQSIVRLQDDERRHRLRNAENLTSDKVEGVGE